jgi:hypothetical protein
MRKSYGNTPCFLPNLQRNDVESVSKQPARCSHRNNQAGKEGLYSNSLANLVLLPVEERAFPSNAQGNSKCLFHFLVSKQIQFQCGVTH